MLFIYTLWKKLLFLAILIFALPFLTIAQSNIKGSLVNEGTNELIPFASVLLFKINTDSLVQGTSTSIEGDFKLENIKNGWYYLKAEFMGFTPIKVDSIFLNKDLNLGVLKMNDGLVIDDVVISIKKPKTVLNVDKKVFNIAENPASIGGSATEVLNNLPSIDVDQDGNISLRGNSNLRILIDGKPTGLSGENIGLILQQIPANSIENIEVITVPSAKYDAESSGGVINIILKRDKAQGLTGSTNINYGNYDKLNASGTIAYAKEKFKINATYAFQNGTFFYRRNGASISSKIDSLRLFSTKNNSTRTETSHLGKLGLIYYFKPSTSIDISSTLSSSNKIDDDKINYLWEYSSSELEIIRLANENASNTNLINNISFDHQFKNKAKIKLQSTYSYTGNEELGDFEQDLVFQEQNSNVYANDFVQNLDITIPFKKTTTEFGAQHTHRIISNNFNFQDKSNSSSIKNDFNYFDDISAIYIVESFELKTFKISAGYRAEYTISNSSNFTNNNIVKREYLMHFPSFSIAKEINEVHQIGFNYSRRITRPNAIQLNPSPSLSDPFNLRSGSPNLIPATNDVAELTWLSKKNKISIQNTLFYQLRKDRIRRVLFIDSNSVSTVQWVNYDREDYFGLEIFMNADIGKYISGNFSIIIYERLTDGTNIDPTYKAEYFGWDSKLNFNIKLPKSFTFSSSSEYKSPKNIVFGTFEPRYFIDFAIKKTILKNKGTIAFRLSDAFNTKNFRINTEVGEWKRNVVFKRESRIAFISFSYAFGAK